MRRLPLVDDARRAASYAWRSARLVTGLVAARPVHAVVQVSNRCNLTCSFCSFWERPAERSDEMTVADFAAISAKLAEAGSLLVSLEGGEPLLRPDLVEIVRAFARHHHPILFTNGWKVNDRLARALFEAGLVEIGVSIDYADAAKHDAHRGLDGTHAAARRAVDVLREAAPRGAKQVSIITVLMEDNADELDALLALSAAHGVRHQVTLISTSGDGREAGAKRRPPPGTGARLAALAERWPHLLAFSGYLASIDRFLDGNPPVPCHAGERFLNIDHTGWVSPCIEKLHLRAGNLRSEPWSVVAERLARIAEEETRGCRDCYTSCRGFVDELSGPPKPGAWREFLSHHVR